MKTPFLGPLVGGRLSEPRGKFVGKLLFRSDPAHSKAADLISKSYIICKAGSDLRNMRQLWYFVLLHLWVGFLRKLPAHLWCVCGGGVMINRQLHYLHFAAQFKYAQIIGLSSAIVCSVTVYSLCKVLLYVVQSCYSLHLRLRLVRSASSSLSNFVSRVLIPLPLWEENL